MIEKIISSGISKIEAGILKLASKYNIKTFGYTSLTLDNGEVPEHLKKYSLKHEADESAVMDKNIDLADGVIWISKEEIPPDEYLNHKFDGIKKGVHFFYVACIDSEIYSVAEKIRNWIIENGIVTLLITDDLKDSSLKSDFAYNLVESVIYMSLMKTEPDKLASPIQVTPPDYKSSSESVSSVVDDLVETLPLKDRVAIGKMKKDELYELFPAIGVTILSKYYWPANNSLKNDCLKISGKEHIKDFDIVEIIITNLWENLKNTHRLRII